MSSTKQASTFILYVPHGHEGDEVARALETAFSAAVEQKIGDDKPRLEVRRGTPPQTAQSLGWYGH